MTEIKNRWAEQQDWNNPSEEGHFHNVLDCCAIKAITGWHIGEVADSELTSNFHNIQSYDNSLEK